jgi:hypothetical protein
MRLNAIKTIALLFTKKKAMKRIICLICGVLLIASCSMQQNTRGFDYAQHRRENERYVKFAKKRWKNSGHDLTQIRCVCRGNIKKKYRNPCFK